MLMPRLLAAAVLRVAVMTALFIAYKALLDRSDSTDALGAGLLFFLIVAVVTLVWAAIDGARRGFLLVAGLWLVASVLISVAVNVAGVVMDSTLSFTLGDVIFFILLWLVPALIGAVLGSPFRRKRAPAHI
jgi:hypothetical protein